MQIPASPIFGCSTCSGVPFLYNPLIPKGFINLTDWNTRHVPACSKVFQMFRLGARTQHDEVPEPKPASPFPVGRAFAGSHQQGATRARCNCLGARGAKFSESVPIRGNQANGGYLCRA